MVWVKELVPTEIGKARKEKAQDLRVGMLTWRCLS